CRGAYRHGRPGGRIRGSQQMKLLDLRKFSVRKQSQIRFRMRNGMECVITERGIAQVPAWKGIPDFNLEDELAAAGEFVLQPMTGGTRKAPPLPRTIQPQELAQMASASPSAA